MKKTILAIATVLTTLTISAQDVSASFERNNEGFYTYASGDLEVDFDNSTDEAAVGS